jgi:hypothetical protein
VARVKYGYRPLTPSECASVARARRRLNALTNDLDGLNVEPVKGRTIYADIESLDYRLSEVQRQLCKR